VKKGRTKNGGATTRRSAVPRSARNGNGSAPARERRPRDRDRTINTILDAAERLLEQKGPDGFGLAELGREADVSFGLIHHYFGGKEGLLRAVLRRTLRQMGREVRRIQEDGTFWLREAPAVLVVFDTFTQRPGFARLLAWGLLTGLIVRDDLADEFRTDATAVGEMIEAFRRESPQETGDAAAIITTLLISAVIGFNLLRPLLTSAFKWTPDEDALLRDQLARAMVGLAGPKGSIAPAETKPKR
jgi:AcrR family transcriptional regulator